MAWGSSLLPLCLWSLLLRIGGLGLGDQVVVLGRIVASAASTPDNFQSMFGGIEWSGFYRAYCNQKAATQSPSRAENPQTPNPKPRNSMYTLNPEPQNPKPLNRQAVAPVRVRLVEPPLQVQQSSCTWKSSRPGFRLRASGLGL